MAKKKQEVQKNNYPLIGLAVIAVLIALGVLFSSIAERQKGKRLEALATNCVDQYKNVIAARELKDPASIEGQERLYNKLEAKYALVQNSSGMTVWWNNY